jgi:hypothetical protein
MTGTSSAGAEQASFIAFHVIIGEIVALLLGKVKPCALNSSPEPPSNQES